MDPRTYTASEVLKDGTAVTIRAIQRGDKSRLLEAFKTLDRESVYRRFFSPKKELSDRELRQGTEGGILIGGGRYVADSPGSTQAEVAFMTDGNYWGRGVASLILNHLMRIARGAGVLRLEADVLAENRPMLAVFRRSGLPMQQHRDGNLIRYTFT